MYTAIQEADGAFLFALHRAPEKMDPARAREALEALEPIVAALRRNVAAEPAQFLRRMGGISRPADPRDERERSRSRRSGRASRRVQQGSRPQGSETTAPA